MIIFLNGSINSGKSTVAKLLAAQLPRTALVEVDVLRNMIDWMPIDEAIPINLENAVALVRNFANNDLNVLVPYPLSEKNHAYVVESLKDVTTKIFFFTLAPRLEKVLSNRGHRELNEWERSRIRHHYDIGIPKPSFGIIIDNSEQTAEETAGIIKAKVS